MNEMRQFKPASLHLFQLPGDGETPLLAKVATQGTLLVTGAIQGELMKLVTNATSNPDAGARCGELDAVVIEHDGGLAAERLALVLAARAASEHERAARAGSPEHHRDALRRLNQAWPSASRVAGNEVSTFARQSADTVRTAAPSPTVDALPAIVASIETAQVATAATAAIAPLVQRLRIDVSRVVHQRDANARAARPDAATGEQRALDEWSGAVAHELEAQATAAEDAAERALADANQYIADLDPDFQDTATPGPLEGIRNWIEGFLSSGANAQNEPEPHAELFAYLRRHLEARLMNSACGQLRSAIGSMVQSRLDEGEVDRLLAPVRDFRGAAERAVLVLDERAQERQRRTNGVFLPADPDIRAELVGDTADIPDGSLADRLIRGQMAELLERTGAVIYGDFEDAVVAEARRLTHSIREASLGQAIEQLSASRVDSLAKVLVNTSPSLDFRPGHPTPAIYRRVAVPGGGSGRLGVAVRRFAPEIDVMPTNTTTQPLMAYGVAATDVFAPTALAGYHGDWKAALEDARRVDGDRRLYSDRRFRDLDDGILSDEDMFLRLVKAIVCGVLESSRDVGGTWYLIPVGQVERPSGVDAARLDSVFRGNRLGKSLPEMVKTLRNAPQHREWIDERWDAWREATRPSDRIARMDTVMARVLLPSDDLVPVCRGLKNREVRESRDAIHEVA